VSPAAAGGPGERQDDRRLVLLTGATGYVGGRLLPELEARSDLRVRCLSRRPESLRGRVSAGTEVVEADLMEPGTLGPALEGVDAAYYLVHSMGEGDDFEEMDRRAAENFARAAREAGVERVVYLGGLGQGSDLSRHLRSRQEVGRILRDSGVPTLEFRASIIIGSGSLSYEMIRTLVERLPVMLLPRWVRKQAQPIAIEDVLAYLLAALDGPADESRVFQIGGADRVSYEGIMREYARQHGLRRLMIPVPVLTPWFSALWLGLVTPLYARIGRKLATSLVHETVVTDPSAEELYGVEPRDIGEAIRRARNREDSEFAASRWSDALSAGGTPSSWGGQRFGARLVDSRTGEVPVPPDRAFAPIRRIGGDTGWYFGDWLWRLRGLLADLVGGVGLRRGRPDPEHLEPGDTLDFWRVERIEPDRLLRLRAEMRLPGRGWLQLEVEPVSDRSASVIRQTAGFAPRGLSGLLYWYGLYPVHALVFRGMLRGICREARRGAPV
jgi:uncharacterized protein YbjT (DUF2867 family)